MKNIKVLALILAAILALLAFSSCGGISLPTGIGDLIPSEVVPSIDIESLLSELVNPTVTGLDDVSGVELQWGSFTDNGYGSFYLPVTIFNRTDDVATFFLTIGAFNESGIQVDYCEPYAVCLQPGEGETVEAFTDCTERDVEVLQEAEYRITEIETTFCPAAETAKVLSEKLNVTQTEKTFVPGYAGYMSMIVSFTVENKTEKDLECRLTYDIRDSPSIRRGIGFGDEEVKAGETNEDFGFDVTFPEEEKELYEAMQITVVYAETTEIDFG